MDRKEELKNKIIALKESIDETKAELLKLEEEFDKNTNSFKIIFKYESKVRFLKELYKQLEHAEDELEKVEEGIAIKRNKKEAEIRAEQWAKEHDNDNEDDLMRAALKEEIIDLADSKCVKDETDSKVAEIIEKYKDMEYIIDDDCEIEDIKEQIDEFEADRKVLLAAMKDAENIEELKDACLDLTRKIEYFDAIYHDRIKDKYNAELIEEIK